MKIENVAIDSLIPYAFNNRVHDELQVNRIANSIKEFGFNQPIVIDSNNIIIVGHGRFEAAKKLGLDSVPVIKVDDLSETQIKAYRILDNKLQNDSTWDFQNLEIELDALQDVGFELEPWGLDKLTEKLEESNEIPDNVELDLNKTFRIEILCDDEAHQQRVYEQLKQEGLNCRLLSL